MKAIAYLRVSGAAQVDGDGPERQAHSTADFAGRSNIQLAIDPRDHLPDLRGYPFFDGGISGTKDHTDRPGFKAALAYCAEHGIDTILVEKSDRLSRDLVVGFSLIAKCQQEGIRIIDCATGATLTDTDDPYAKFILQVMFAAAELNKNLFVHQTAKAKRRIRERTGKCDGAKGYKELAPLAFQRARALRDAGQTYRQIAESLNSESIPTLKGTPWSFGTVHGLLEKAC